MVPYGIINWSTMAQAMACHLFGTKPLSEPTLTYCQLNHSGIPKSCHPVSYTHWNSKGSHQLLTTCILGTNLKFPINKTINDWTHSQGSGNHKDHGMMTSSNGNIFRVTGPLCREFTGHRWIPLTKASDVELWCFLWFGPVQRAE